MAGYVIMHGLCAACRQPIQYNPHKVPSITVDGSREAICESCFRKWNEIHRVSKGLPPILLQEGAYKAIPENEL